MYDNTARKDVLVSDESYVRICILEKRYNQIRHSAGEVTPVLLLKPHRVRKPANHVSQCAILESDQYASGARVVVMQQH